MIKQQHHAGHSDLAPSSKDWNPAASGHDSDYTPEKDLWAQTHPRKGDVQPERDFGKSQRPGKDKKSPEPHSHADDVVRPDPDDASEKLDEALQESFPASDPPAPAHPDVTGWDLDDEAVERAGGKR
jgi:hypothetical protein